MFTVGKHGFYGPKTLQSSRHQEAVAVVSNYNGGHSGCSLRRSRPPQRILAVAVAVAGVLLLWLVCYCCGWCADAVAVGPHCAAGSIGRLQEIMSRAVRSCRADPLC